MIRAYIGWICTIGLLIAFAVTYSPSWGLDGWTESGVEEFPAHWVGNADPRTLRK